MNIPDFTSLLKQPNEISSDQTNEIESILEDYPYFQAARILHLKGLKKQHSFKYNAALKTSAAYTTNRTVLFDFITSGTLDAVADANEQEHLITDSEVIDVEVVDENTAVIEPQTEKIAQVKEKLAIGKPLVFDLSEMHSFHEWLQLSSLKPIERESEKPQKQEREKKFELIEEFIKNNPKIPPIKTGTHSDVGFQSVTENENLMTETLARVYLEQKKYGKAMKAFKILSLKYPEKSSFFADRIKAIKFLQKNNS